MTPHVLALASVFLAAPHGEPNVHDTYHRDADRDAVDLELSLYSRDDAKMVCDLARDVSYACDFIDPIHPAPVPELEAKLEWDRGGYWGVGVSPGATVQTGVYGGGVGFNPMTRWDMEFGWGWYHPEKRREVRAGVDLHLMQFYGRRVPGGGADVVVSGAIGPVYLRGGVGALGGLPRSTDVEDYRPAIGGVVGLGLQGRRDDLYGRIGVDYDARVTTDLEFVQTVMLVARLEFNWY